MLVIWITVRHASTLLEVTESAIKKALVKGKYAYRYVNGIGRGGRVIQISLESLPQAAQDRYNGIERDLTKEAAEVLPYLTQAQRDTTREKEQIVLEYQRFKEIYPGLDKQRAFLAKHNTAHPDEPLTKRMLNHWQHLYERDGINGLVDRRGGYNRGQTSIPEKAHDVFLYLWLQEKGTKHGGPAIAACYRLTKEICCDMELPSISAFERLARSVPPGAQTYYRRGKKAFEDRFMPTIRQDYTKSHTNERWVGDNHILDVMVRFPDGNVGRPWIIAWQDFRSRYIVSHLIVPRTPNSNDIRKSAVNGFRDCGVPESMKMDNGLDYMTYDLFDKAFPLSLANELGIRVSNTIPYNAKAKPVERTWGTLEYGYLIFLDSYIGADPKRRPEKMQTVNEKLKSVAIPYDDLCTYVEKSIATYNNSPHSGDGMNGRTPKQAFEEEITVPLRTVNEFLLADLSYRTSPLLTVGKNGIRVPILEQYYNSVELAEHYGQKVYARYDTEDIRQVYCVSEDGKFLCWASSVALGSLDQEMTAQNMREINNQRKQIRKKVRDFKPNISVPSVQQLAIERDMSFDKPDLRALPAVSTADSEHQRRARASQEAKRQKEAQESPDQRRIRQEEQDAYTKLMLGG